MIVDIKDKSGNIRFSTPINKGSKRKFSLMKEDYITLKFSLDSPVYFNLGDGIDNELGMFELVNLYKPVYNSGTGGYDYELRLDAYYWKWKNKKFFFTPEAGSREAGWNQTDSLEAHMKVFLKNLTALGYNYKGEEFTCIIDDTVDTSSKLISYDNVNLIDALNQMAETFECEWWVIKNEIHFGRCEDGEPVDFELGVNVQSMSRSDSQSTYATRIYAFGSTRNIPPTYRKSLIFDVKKASGRDISDTARPLDIKLFPAHVIHEEKYSARDSEDHLGMDRDVLEWSRSRPLSYEAKSGVYQITSEGITAIVKSYIVRDMNFTTIQLPRGKYVCNARFTYQINGVQKVMHLGSQTIVVGDDSTYKVQATFNVPDRMEIEMDATELQVEVYGSAPSPWIPETKIFPSADYLIKFVSAPYAITSVTFLSGLNEGKTFDAIYNPDLLTGDAANILRLPEGFTASVGDRYAIDDIIKSKVPASYFSDNKAGQTAEGIVAKHLMLPEGVSCIDAFPDMKPEEAVEQIVVFDDIYPRREGVTANVTTHPYTDIIDNADGSKTESKWTAWRFKDADLGFHFSKEYRIDSKDLMVKFQSGPLAGMEFEVIFNPYDSASSDKPQSELLEDGTWNPKAQVYEIVRNNDYGRMLPDDALHPSEDGGDVYVLSGYDPQFVSDALIPNAEKELLERAKEYMEKSKQDPSTYDNTMMSDYIYGINPDTGKQDAEFAKNFIIGQRVNLINKAYFVDGRISRIIGFEFNLDMPYDSPVYTVGETAPYSRIGELENKIDSITFKKEKGSKQLTSNSSSSSGGSEATAKFPKNIEVTADKVGYYKAGDVILAGTKVVDALITMLSQAAKASLQGKLSTANDVEFGSEKGTITYTAVRNGQGKMEQAYYDDNPNNMLNFSEEVGGVQTATRKLEGVYTQSEKYTATVVYAANDERTLSSLTLTNKISVNVKRKWFAGVCNSIPATSADVRALANSGLYNGPGSYKFTIGNYRTFVICIPSDVVREVSLERYQYNFMDLDSAATPRKINVEGANGSAAVEYTMYVFSTATTSTETDNFTFKTN